MKTKKNIMEILKHVYLLIITFIVDRKSVV